MKCAEQGTEAEPVLLPCEGCGAGGFINFEPCPDCGGTGYEPLLGCPMRMTDENGWAALMAADQAELGVWPVGGGWLDQTNAALDAVRMVRGEVAELRSRKGGAQTG